MPKIGYYTTTYKKRLYTNNLAYFKLTQEIFDDLIKKYYEIIFQDTEVLKLSNQKCLAELERSTVLTRKGPRKGEIPKYYFKQNAPVELRRAAINQAIGMARSYFEMLKLSEKNDKIKAPNKATTFNCSLILYKEMYKNIQKDGTFNVKLFDGENWKWFKAKFKDWNFSEECQVLSPTIVIKKDYILAHIPIRKKIEDTTTIKERLNDKNTRICGIAFTSNNNVAVCTIIDSKGEFVKSLFVSGGSKYKHEITRILNKQKKNFSTNKNLTWEKGNHKEYREKIKRIVNYYSHSISRKIVDFCKENQVRVIVIPYASKDKVYYYQKSRKNSPIYLRENITKFLEYKAFREGILTTTAMRKDKASKCYKCNGKIKSRKLKTVCENGHEVDYYFNYAMNVALDCLFNYKR